MFLDQTCADLQKQHVVHAIVDLHVSDSDGQQQKDMWQNTAGKDALCKVMVNALDAMEEFEDIVRGAEVTNPHNGELHKLSIQLHGHARPRPNAKPKSKPARTMEVSYNGVLINGNAPNGYIATGTRSIHKAPQSNWTPSDVVEGVQARAAGQQQLAVIQEL